jgi:hypothetical protein
VRPILLIGTAIVVILAYGLPLTFVPLRWARTVGWTVPDDVRLVRYFARSLGTVVLALAFFVIYLARQPAFEAPAAGVTALALGLVSMPHFVGMVEGSQPLFETIEGFGFLALAGVFAWLAI